MTSLSKRGWTYKWAAASLLGAGLLAGCSATGPSNFRIHEVSMYGANQERVVWAYGNLNAASSSVKLGGTAVELRPQVADVLTTAGSLSINGKAVYRTGNGTVSPKLSLTRDATRNSFNIASNDSSIAAVFYTDGAQWYKLNGTSGTVGATLNSGLRGAGQLTDAEGDALGRALAAQGPLAVAVFNDNQAGIAVEPRPAESLRTSLYIANDVQEVGTQTVATVVTTPNTQTGNSTNGGSVSTASVSFTEVARGTSASVTTPTVMTATTDAQARSLYAVAYGNQSSRPTPPALSGDTLVGIFAGRYSTGGYSVKVASAIQNGSALTIQANIEGPGKGMLTTQALTSPWVILRVSGSFSQVNVVDAKGKPLQ